MSAFERRGWTKFAFDAATQRWAKSARDAALQIVEAPDQEHWWRHGRTWFVGVDALANREDGSIGDCALQGPSVSALNWRGGWHRAQVSVVRPGYPKRDLDETAGAHDYRCKRDAAHLDGLLPLGPDRRRMMKEFHAFILGLPLNDADLAASPLTVWEGSHHLARGMFRRILGDHPPTDWHALDVTEAYHSLRRQIFQTCRRVELPARPGEAVLLHPMVLHGVAPWGLHARAATEGRMIAYFRPETTPEVWLEGEAVARLS